MRMSSIVVKGGQRLRGAVAVEGAKNSALKLMAAALMAPGASRITNVRVIRPKESLSYGDSYPRWSPDSSLIVYNSSYNGRMELVLFDLATATNTSLTGQDAGRVYPCFEGSPM